MKETGAGEGRGEAKLNDVKRHNIRKVDFSSEKTFISAFAEPNRRAVKSLFFFFFFFSDHK